MESYDIIIIGAGIIGSSISYNLVKDGYNAKKILVIDKDVPAGEKSSTALSAGGFRNLWATTVNMKMCTYSINEYEKMQNEEKMDIGFEKAGYLFLKNKEQWKQAKKMAKLQKKNGVKAELLKPKEIQKMIPRISFKVDEEVKEFFNLDDIVGGIFGADCGFIEPYRLSTEMLSRTHKEGVKVKARSEVTEIIRDEYNVYGVKTKTGEIIYAPIIVNAAGPSSGKVARLAGITLPISPVNRQIFVTTSPFENFKIPMVVLDNGAYMRSEMEDLLFGRANKDEPEAKEINNEFRTHSDKQYFMNEIYPYFLAKFPGMDKGMKVKASWGGLYEVNTMDHNAIIGPVPEMKGFYICSGFSGHGIMEGCAAGKCISDLIIKGDYVTIPEARQLRYERFREGDLVKELAII